MSKRIYSSNASQADQFGDFDGKGYFIDISDEDFNKFVADGTVYSSGGNYYAAANFVAPPKDTSGGIYANPGVTLKRIATAIFIIGAIASVILAFVLGRSVDLWTGESTFSFGLFIGILLGGVLVSYLSGLGLATLGDIAVNLNKINRKIQ